MPDKRFGLTRLMQRFRSLPLLDLALAGAFMALAGYLRFVDLETAPFNFDEAYAMELAADILESDPFTASGLPSSIGLVNSSAFPYLLTIPLLFKSDPLWATGFIALLNTVAVGGCYAIARRWFGLGAAVIATCLFAVNPWAVVYSRKIWAQNSLAIVTVALLACLLLYQKGRRPWWGAAAMLAWAVGIQIHLAAAALLPVMVVSLATGVNRNSIRPLVVGGLLFLASFAPLLFSDAGTSWNRLPTVLSEGRLSAESWRLMQELVIGDGEYAYFENSGASPIGRLLGDPSAGRFFAIGVMIFLAPISALHMLARPFRNGGLDDRGWRRMTLGLASISAPLVFMYHPGGRYDLHTYYLVTIWPAAFIAVGVLLDDLTIWLRQVVSRGRAALRACWAVLALWLFLLVSIQLSDHAGFLRYTRAKEGMTVGRANAIVDEVRSIQDAGEVYLVNLSFGRAVTLRSAFRGRYPARASTAHDALSVVIGQEPTILILQSDDRPMTRQIESDLTARGELAGRISLGGDSGPLSLYRVEHGPALERCRRAPPAATLFGGRVALTGTRLAPTDGKDVVATHCLAVQQRPPDLPDQLKVFNHLVDDAGNRVAQADGLGHVAEHWKDGDLILNYYLLSMPSDLADGDYHLLLGLYRLDTGDRFPIAQGAQSAEQALTGPYAFEEGRLQRRSP